MQKKRVSIESEGTLSQLEWNISNIVLKLVSVVDSVRVLGHWLIGRTIESLVEPHDGTGLNWMTWLDNSVSILDLYWY
jgi:hypothetical protein